MSGSVGKLAVLGVLVAVAAGVAMQLPELRRYMKIRQM
jgi:hypothetical protein